MQWQLRTCSTGARPRLADALHGSLWAILSDRLRGRAVAAARDRVLVFEAAEKLGSPLVVMTGRERTPADGPTIAGIKALLPLIEDKPIRLALEPHYARRIQFLRTTTPF